MSGKMAQLVSRFPSRNRAKTWGWVHAAAAKKYWYKSKSEHKLVWPAVLHSLHIILPTSSSAPHLIAPGGNNDKGDVENNHTQPAHSTSTNTSQRQQDASEAYCADSC
jgi:hypothetical protein